MDAPNLTDSVKLKDTDALKSLLYKISHKSESYLESQKDEIKSEDESSDSVFVFMHTMYFVIFIQVIIVVMLTVYQLLSFRKVILEHFFIY